MKPLVILDPATAELEEATAWYERQCSGLGGKFRVAVEDAFRRIIENTQAGSRYAATRFRYVLVRRFPYVVFYHDSPRLAHIMAVAHGRRKPGYWKNRKTT